MVNNLKNSLYEVIDAADSAVGSIFSEVNGGRWNDAVGTSYLEFAQNVRYNVESLRYVVDSLANMEGELNDINISADRNDVARLKSEVNRL